MVSIQGKPRDSSHNESPGPGTYEAKIDTVKDRVVTFDMAKSSKKDPLSQF